MNTEKFDMVVKFKNSYKPENRPIDDLDEQVDEILGIKEIEYALMPRDPELYIKESESFNVVLVELGTDSLEAAKLLRKSNPRIVSRVVPITKVVKTDLMEIARCIKELALDKMEPGDNFTIETSVVSQKTIESKEIVEMIEGELNKLDMNFHETNPKWKIYVEVIGENTGLNILKTEESELCLSK